jgi:hypothetical protein
MFRKLNLSNKLLIAGWLLLLVGSSVLCSMAFGSFNSGCYIEKTIIPLSLFILSVTGFSCITCFVLSVYFTLLNLGAKVEFFKLLLIAPGILISTIYIYAAAIFGGWI